MEGRSKWKLFVTITKAGFWLALIVIVIGTASAPSRLNAARDSVINKFQEKRKSRVIAMIHRQETVNLVSIPVSSMITIEDSEAILRAIRLTPPDQPIDLILHTPGGLVLAAEQIARALVDHKGKVSVIVPHYAMSGGTLIALTADEIVMDPNAVLGPIDPQIGDMPAASIVKLVSLKTPSRVSDEMFILADVAEKARTQVAVFTTEILMKHFPREKAAALATLLSEGRWTHDFPITVETAREMGLPVSTNVDATVYELMDLYPQADAARPSVIYVPTHRDHKGPEGDPLTDVR
jgi:ClpP class serine protease